MKVIFILFIAWCECQKNTTIVRKSNTDISSNYSSYEIHEQIIGIITGYQMLLEKASVRNPMGSSFFGTSISTIPKVSDFSGVCPNSSCRDNVTEDRGVSLPVRGCYCDKLCIGLRDCCEDSIFYDAEEQRKPRTVDCVFNRIGNTDGYYVNRGCPRSWKDWEHVKKCVKSSNMNLNTKDLHLMMPVTSLSTGMTYGNIFCAICNDDDNLCVWNIKIPDFCYAGNREMRLKNATDLKFNGKHWYFMKNQTKYVCELILSKPDGIKLKKCHPKEAFQFRIEDSCRKNWTDLKVSNQCQGAYAVVYQHFPELLGSAVYKNKFCAYCNGLNDSQIFCQPLSIGKKHSLEMFGERNFSVTFDFNIDFSGTEVCRKGVIKGKLTTASKKRFCPMDAEKIEFSEKTENLFFKSYTSIALLISLILLICHLLVFAVVKKLHTIGGKNLASFCFALILAYGNFLAGNYLEGNACFVVSIVTYYSFLSAFSWMFTISFDIWKTFRDLTKKLKRPRKSKFKFLLYSIWSWTMPAFVVSIAVYLDLSKSYPALAPHFGRNECWFHNGYSLLLFFVIPVSVIILINFVLFLHVSLILHSNKCKSANQKAYVDFKLFARIGLLTGFTWITGFIAGYFQSIVIWYIFIILNTGQGFLIFLGFTCKKKIISIALQKIGLSCCLTASFKKLGT